MIKQKDGLSDWTAMRKLDTESRHCGGLETHGWFLFC